MEEDTCENIIVRAQVTVIVELNEQTDRRPSAVKFDLKDFD
jgi:hypothetical protein